MSTGIVSEMSFRIIITNVSWFEHMRLSIYKLVIDCRAQRKQVESFHMVLVVPLLISKDKSIYLH